MYTIEPFPLLGTKTISGGVITLDGLSGIYLVDTEGLSAQDDLNTINNAGGVTYLFPASDARTVSLRHLVGNLHNENSLDIHLNQENDYAIIVNNGSELTVTYVNAPA